ncbi:GNAT family N-acetyltransferase [Leucobacter sp. NPDC015123]|uniref:GNAT family N-acetyltransferase n=1 Tax=Leucobacter sp. NPDC015123 TaxID=3364129 RepID=UPI0036F4927E
MAEQLGSQGAAGSAVARRMVRDDWEWIHQWFEDETLNTELGPLDNEWLEHVLTENDGVELVIEAAHPATGKLAPIALVGVVWGAPEADPRAGGGAEDAVTGDRAAETGHAITDLAIDPARRGFGLGRTAINATMAWPDHPATDSWIAFVDQENEGARRFFEAIGWTYEGLDGEGDDAMHRFATHAP